MAQQGSEERCRQQFGVGQGLPSRFPLLSSSSTSAKKSNRTEREPQFTQEQKEIYGKVVNSSLSNISQLYFLEGPTGTGKTFLYNTLAARIRSERRIVVCVASTGIAAQLLMGGRTAHSTFKIPLDIHESSGCNIPKNSALALPVNSMQNLKKINKPVNRIKKISDEILDA